MCLKNLFCGLDCTWILFIIIMAVTGLLFLSSKKWVYYEDGGN